MKKNNAIDTDTMIKYLNTLQEDTPTAKKERERFNKKLHKSTGNDFADMFLKAINI